MKVISAGYPKSGTKSLTKALKILGYDKVYDHVEALEFGFDEWEKILNNESSDIDEVFDKVYADGVEAVVDLPHSFFFEKFLRRWPDAKVVLTVRDEDQQYQSFRNMMDDAMQIRPIFAYISYILSPTSRRYGRWTENMMNMTMGGMDGSRLKWIEMLRRQQAYVKEVVPKEQLLVFNVREGWEPLCKFLGKPVPQQDFPFENKRGCKDSIANQVVASKLIKRVEVEVKRGLFWTCVVICLIAVFIKFVM